MKNPNHLPHPLTPCQIAAYAAAGGALLLTLKMGLVAALFGGLLVYSLIHMLAPLMARRISGTRARLVAVALISLVVLGALAAATWGTVAFFRSDAGNLQNLLRRLADIIETSRGQFPAWLTDLLPGDADGITEWLSGTLRAHAAEAKMLGAEAARTTVHVLIGMIVGAMVAVHDARPVHLLAPLAAALQQRVALLSDAFRRIVFAQVWISGINTAVSAVFILVVLPLAGIHLPLAKSLIAVTFFAGLVPVLGNLVSNTFLVIVSLSHSLNTAIASLTFMVVIHKLEYFLNARIIGSQINAHAWELLAVMLVMESAFGVPGVVAAPVFYAYAKKELEARALI